MCGFIGFLLATCELQLLLKPMLINYTTHNAFQHCYIVVNTDLTSGESFLSFFSEYPGFNPNLIFFVLTEFLDYGNFFSHFVQS